MGNSQKTNSSIPKTGFAGLAQNWKQDLISGLSVSLIALPLCLGISLASGVPPIAGIFTAIIGGILASRISGSFVTISGPAAGLIVITLSAVESLGGGDHVVGYPFALAAIVVAGLFVVLFGLLKVGKLGDFFPSAAVHGMLAAIGIIIIIKQAYVAIGVQAPKGELLEVAMHLPIAFASLNPEILVIAAISLAILIVYPMIDNKYIKLIPAPMWVLLATIPLSFAFDLFDEHHYHFAGADYVIGPKYLVNLPSNLGDAIVFPDFGKIATGTFWIAVISFALVSGLESLLSAKAVDTLDPFKRKSNLNRDLMAMGGGSAMAAAIGGLPMISEIVRSSANINNGGKTQWANFFHGVFLLVFILFLKPIIMMIPLSALAAMLIFTGFRLASPKEFKHMLHIDWKQLLVFVTTIVVVILTDLLIGIAAGIVLELVINLLLGASIATLVKAKTESEVNGDFCTIKIHSSAIFSNYLSLKTQILKHSNCKNLILDFENVRLVDHTVMSNLSDLQADFSANGRVLKFVNMTHLKAVTGHPLAPRVMNKEGQHESLLKNMTRRQLELMVFAVQNKYDYLPEDWEEHHQWQGFPSMDGKKIQRVTSLFVKKGKGYRISLADLDLSSGALLTLENTVVTRMRINFKDFRIPEFALFQETPLDKIAERLGAQDIDFVEYPKFSEAFMLQGSDENAIRVFFSPAMLEFHEQNLEFFVESKGDSVLVSSNTKLADPKAIEAMMSFGHAYAKLIQDSRIVIA